MKRKVLCLLLGLFLFAPVFGVGSSSVVSSFVPVKHAYADTADKPDQIQWRLPYKDFEDAMESADAITESLKAQYAYVAVRVEARKSGGYEVFVLAAYPKE